MRDRMLGSVSWTGQERVLDIGTGAGLLLVGAARRLAARRLAARRLRGGVAVGVDIWSAPR